MTIYLVRHASAGTRGSHSDDAARPLDDHGRAQAQVIADSLAAAPIDAIYSSRAIRCIETVQPLAAVLGIDIEPRDSLYEGSPAHDAFVLVEETLGAASNAVLCSHGDLIPDVLQLLVNRGLELGPGQGFAKGSVWTLHTDGRQLTAATYSSTKV